MLFQPSPPERFASFSDSSITTAQLCTQFPLPGISKYVVEYCQLFLLYIALISTAFYIATAFTKPHVIFLPRFCYRKLDVTSTPF